jgi:hypothetical protein
MTKAWSDFMHLQKNIAKTSNNRRDCNGYGILMLSNSGKKSLLLRFRCGIIKSKRASRFADGGCSLFGTTKPPISTMGGFCFISFCQKTERSHR